MKAPLLALTVALAALTPAQFGGPVNDPFNNVRWATVDGGSDSAIRDHRVLVLNSDWEWQDVWRTIRGIPPGQPAFAPRVVDWTFEQLVVVNLGEQPAGTRLWIDNIWRPTGFLWQVDVVVQEPSRERPGRTVSPYVVVRMNKQMGEPSFVFRRQEGYGGVGGGWWSWGGGHCGGTGVWILRNGKLVPYEP